MPIKFRHKRRDGTEAVIEGELIAPDERAKEIVFDLPGTGYRLKCFIIMQQVIKATEEKDDLGNPIIGYTFGTIVQVEPMPSIISKGTA
jgi:hypothetical protein